MEQWQMKRKGEQIKHKATERDIHSKDSHFTVRTIIIKNTWKDLMANHTHQKIYMNEALQRKTNLKGNQSST